MTRNTATSHGQPSIEELMVRFLANGSDIVESGEFEPHEVAAGFRVDPRAAWIDAMTNTATAPVPLPPDWATLVNHPASAFAVPMAVGNFPQRVRDLQPLLTKFNPAELRASASQTPLPGLTALRNWIAKHAATQPELAGGLARLIGDFDLAEQVLPATAGNERAAVLWQRGECDKALATWNALADSPAVLFNRGMALLFLGKLAEAKAALAKAIDAVPEASGWNALARLYLAVAEIHG